MQQSLNPRSLHCDSCKLSVSVSQVPLLLDRISKQSGYSPGGSSSRSWIWAPAERALHNQAWAAHQGLACSLDKVSSARPIWAAREILLRLLQDNTCDGLDSARLNLRPSLCTRCLLLLALQLLLCLLSALPAAGMLATRWPWRALPPMRACVFSGLLVRFPGAGDQYRSIQPAQLLQPPHPARAPPTP